MQNIIIGIDHGNGLIKTQSISFKTGVKEYREKPPIETKFTVRIADKYLICDSGRGSIKKDKTVDENYWYATLAAIGYELSIRDIPYDTHQDITIAAGVPLTYSNQDKRGMTNYLKRGNVTFWFDDRKYRINISEVFMFAQGYSAVMTDIREIKEQPVFAVIDIGSWTVDAILLNYGKANLNTARSLEFGVIRLVDMISEHIRSTFKKSILQEQIEAVWENANIMLNEKIKIEIIKQTKLFVEDLVRQLIESGFNLDVVPCAFIGGGAKLFERFYAQDKLEFAKYFVDIKANATGYELLAKAMINRKRQML